MSVWRHLTRSLSRRQPNPPRTTSSASRPPPLPAPLTASRHSSFISIDIWDLPGGQLDPDSWNISFEKIGAVIFVLDAQSTFHDMIRKLAITMHKAFVANPGIQFEIFLHKIDGMSEDYRLGGSLA